MAWWLEYQPRVLEVRRLNPTATQFPTRFQKKSYPRDHRIPLKWCELWPDRCPSPLARSLTRGRLAILVQYECVNQPSALSPQWLRSN